MHGETFDYFLQTKHDEIYEGIKDNVEEAYETWLGQMDVQEIMDYAEEWGNKLKACIK